MNELVERYRNISALHVSQNRLLIMWQRDIGLQSLKCAYLRCSIHKFPCSNHKDIRQHHMNNHHLLWVTHSFSIYQHIWILKRNAFDTIWCCDVSATQLVNFKIFSNFLPITLQGSFLFVIKVYIVYIDFSKFLIISEYLNFWKGMFII